MLFSPSRILIPQNTDLSRWSVIACDQFSSEREYWTNADEIVGGEPSTLRLILPEVYLHDGDTEQRTAAIGRTAQEYLTSDVFAEYADSFVFVERTLTGEKLPDGSFAPGKIRRGIVGALDLERYDPYGNPEGIRATEETVPERLPPRRRARRASCIESPHIMALLDDANGTVIEPINPETLEVLYDFDLMQGAGHITGYRITGDEARRVSEAVEALDGIMIGDGNHSLAAAKLAWEDLRETLSPAERETHPARFALAELMNVYDPAIEFFAIHRIVFGVAPQSFIDGLINAVGGDGSYVVQYLSNGIACEFHAKNAPIGEIIAAVQDYIDTADKSGVDYIHGNDVLASLAEQSPSSVGILLPSMEKSDLFGTVRARGTFPRKSFSIGHADDKRFYLECRDLKWPDASARQ